jgi:hypothetical protein
VISTRAIIRAGDPGRDDDPLGNLTPADVYFGRGHIILMEREKIKRQTIEYRRMQHRKNAV